MQRTGIGFDTRSVLRPHTSTLPRGWPVQVCADGLHARPLAHCSDSGVIALALHSTHWPTLVPLLLQALVGKRPHAVSALQGPQVWSALQTGADAPQWSSARHGTHWLLDLSQWAPLALPLQSTSSRHSTQV
jgi:hypothetical protein